MSFGQAFIILGTINGFLQLPSLFDRFKSQLLELLTSDKYLSTLPPEKLLSYRSDTLKSYYQQKVSSVDESLLKLDERLCELLVSPYFEMYREYNELRKNAIDGNSFYEKTVTTVFELINPAKDQFDALKTLDFGLFFSSIEGVEDQEIRQILSIKISKDQGKFEYLTNSISVKTEKVHPKRAGKYDIVTKLDISDLDREKFKFSDNFKIEYVEKRVLPIHDKTYSFRIGRPTKSFIMNFTCNDPEFDIIGNCFGTLMGPNRNDILTTRDSNSLSIETREWLLSGNGFFLAIIPKFDE